MNITWQSRRYWLKRFLFKLVTPKGILKHLKVFIEMLCFVNSWESWYLTISFSECEVSILPVFYKWVFMKHSVVGSTMKLQKLHPSVHLEPINVILLGSNYRESLDM